MFTTVGTVEVHLTRIYRKLGLRSRADLARGVADGTIELADHCSVVGFSETRASDSPPKVEPWLMGRRRRF